MTAPVDNVKTVTCGVVGAGAFGAVHAAKYGASARARLAGIYDPSLERAQAVAGKYDGATAFATIEELLAACDAVSVCSPATYHGEQAGPALQAGCHVLVEKPLASSALQAAALVTLAEGKGLHLHAGHQERFVARAAGLFDAPPPRQFRSLRVTGPGERGRDVSVIMDLMIHDLDMALRLIGSPPERIEAIADMDQAIAKIWFQNGAYAELMASRVSDEPQRRNKLQWEDGGVAHLDYLAKELHSTATTPLNLDFASHPDAKDSVGANIESFLASILDGAPAAAPGREAAAAAALAEAIEHTAGLRLPIEAPAGS